MCGSVPATENAQPGITLKDEIQMTRCNMRGRPASNEGNFRLKAAGSGFGLVIVGLVTVIAMAVAVLAQTPESKPNEGSAEAARGKYLVENVAMCGQCHTPRNKSGEIDRSRWLQGAPVPWVPAQPQADWPLTAPRIGGSPPATDEDMIKLLTTGVWAKGKPLRLPMMPFRMSEADAKAVVAYLKIASPRY